MRATPGCSGRGRAAGPLTAANVTPARARAWLRHRAPQPRAPRALSRWQLPADRPRAGDGCRMPPQSRRQAANSASFETMDASRPVADGPFDIIAMSMILHWLADPVAVLGALQGLLAPGGSAPLRDDQRLEFSGMARRSRSARICQAGSSTSPSFPASSMRSASSPAATRSTFLRRMKAVGGLTPKRGICAALRRQLRRAIRLPTAIMAAASPGTSFTAGSARSSGRAYRRRSSPSMMPA